MQCQPSVVPTSAGDDLLQSGAPGRLGKNNFERLFKNQGWAGLLLIMHEMMSRQGFSKVSGEQGWGYLVGWTHIGKVMHIRQLKYIGGLLMLGLC